MHAVTLTDKVASKNPTLPVLAGLYLEAKGGTLTIKATNLDLGVTVAVPVKVLEPGSVVVPAQVLGAFLNSLPKGKTITLTSDDKTLVVKTGGTRSTMKTLPAEDFPLIPEVADDGGFSIPAKDLVAGIKAVSYAAAVGSIKPEISSICLSYEKGELVFAATDSFRLAEKRVKIKETPSFSQILIPQKNATEIARILDTVTEDVSLTIEDNQLAFRAGDLYLTSRVISGTFPDYKQIIPKESTSSATVLKQDLIASLRTSLIFSDAFNQLKFNVVPKEKKFEVETKNQNVGESSYNIPAALEGAETVISVNHRYFTDCFPSLATDSVSVSFSGEGRPIILRSVGDKSFLYLVMPMNRS